MKLLLISALCLPLVSGAAELTIPEEPAFTEPAPLPPAQLPEGRLHKPVSPEWGCRSLDGEWRFRKVPFVKGRDERNDEGIRDRLFAAGVDDAGWERITVPGSWWLHNGWDASPGKLGYYRRTFEIKPEETGPNRRVILDFRRVSDRADVWVNGKSAGEPHFGRAASFQYDIGALVKPGKNELAVRVYDYQGGSTGWRAHIGGICDGVRLLTLPGGCFVSGAMITPDLKSGTVAIQVRTIAPQPGRGLTAEIVDPESDTVVASRQFGGFAVPAGTGWIELGTVAIPSPRLWTPGDPFRYVLRLRDPAGNTVGFEPFGFREFKAEGEWLMLNGRKFKPRMFTYTTQWVRRVHNNIGHSSERLLRMMKDQLHVNMIRPHSMDGTPFEGLYEICDRIGMLVYFDWSGPGGHQAYDKKWNDSILEAAPELEAFIRDNYNRPCLAMWSLGNEIYEGHYNLYFSQNLDKLYGMVKKLDRQNRPVCSSSGRQSIEALQSGLLKERTDVADDHQYRGSYCGSWQENIGHITYYAQVARHHFNRPIPKIDAEYGVPGDCARYRGDLTQQAVAAVLAMPRDTAAFKEAYAKMLRDPRPEVGGYLRLLSNYATPDDYAAKKPLYRKYGFRYAKRPIEIYRRAGVECLGGHTNIQWYDLVREFPDGYHVADLPQAPPEEWRVMPPFYWIARCYNPTLVSAGVFNQQPYAGRDEKAEVFVTNDLNEDGDFEVVSQFRLESGTVITLPALKFGTVPAMGQKSLILEYRTPDCRRIERGRLELYLFRDGRRVGDNCYDLSIFPARKTGLPTRCALYDSAGAKFRGLLKTPTTTGVLRQLGCRAQAIRNFDRLDEFTHLIIGGNCFDQIVLDNGDRLFRWVKSGGKLLVMEQSLCGKVPFLANYSVVSGNPGTLATLVDPAHPVFKSLRQEEMDSWIGNQGRMSRFALAPLDAGMVAVSPLAASGDPECYKAILCDVKVGRGEVILSQLAASERMRESGAAGEYLCSLLEYFAAPDVSKFAMAVPDAASGRVRYLADKDAFHFDLSRAVNRSFSDDKAGDRQGGWTDFGASADFRSIPTGVTRLQGGVPFRILDPAKNNSSSCIVLKGEKRPYFPERADIPVNALLNTIYVLHTAMYANEPGPAVRYILRYEDGKTHEFAADTRYDLPDWWEAKSRRNAEVVFRDGEKGLFVSEFVNPRPNVKITGLEIVSAGKAIPVVVAVTGRIRLSSTISGVGEK